VSQSLVARRKKGLESDPFRESCPISVTLWKSSRTTIIGSSGKAIASLATEELSQVHTRAFNQDGVLVAEFKRLVLDPP